MTVATSTRTLRSGTARQVGRERTATHRWRAPALILLVGIAAWLVALPALHDAPWNVFGLMVAAGPLFAVSLALVSIAFCIAIGVDARRTAGAALLATVLMMRLPTAVAVDAPLYSWTYKHFGVIDYIQRFGGVRQDIDIYHNWPGAFSFFAWINTITGTETMVLAQWFAVVAQLALVAGVYFLCRSRGSTTSVALVAAFIAHAANWVAQDYLSPQAIAFTLGIVVIALMLASRTSRAAAWVALPIFAAIVVTHQLTPYWLIAMILLLTLVGRIRPRYIVAIFAAMAIGYALMHLDVLERFGSLLDIDPFANMQTNSDRIISNPSIGQVVNALAARVVAATIWLGSAAALAWQFWRNRSDWRATATAASVAFASVLILLGQSYGGEAIFRVFLYSLPGCAMILAPIAVTLLRGGITRGRRTLRVAAAAAVAFVTLLSAQAYYGAWFANVVTRESITIATDILKNETPNTLTIGVAPGAPGRLVAEYVEFVENASGEFDVGIDTWLNSWEGWQGENFASPAAMQRLTDDLIFEQRPAVVLITSQMLYYTEYFGTFPEGSLDRFVQRLREEPRWDLEYSTPDVLMFRLDLDGASQ